MSKINETNYPRRTQANYADTDMLVIQAAGGNTYTTRIEDLREDCQETLAPALNTMRENLATVEGSTASKAYAKGDFLVFGGRLCKAKTSIASGATLVLDTNIELDSVGDELSSLTSELTSLPVAMASGKVGFPAASVGGQDIDITFPTGRFTSPPIVVALMSDTTSLSVPIYFEADLYVYNVTTTGCKLHGTRKNANYTWYAHWIAVQM